MEHLKESTMIVKAAAVADYHRVNAPSHKVKKTAARLSLELDPTPDILAELGRKKGDRLLVGFAAETENLVEEARRKLESKNCDMVVANLVSQEGPGLSRTRTRCCWCCARARRFRCGARPRARSRTASSTR